jgi:hypothetical protein
VASVSVAVSNTIAPVTTGPRSERSVLTVGLATMCSVIEHSACPPVLVALNVMTNTPNWDEVGVHEKTLDTGAFMSPTVGSAGSIVEPGGNPATFNVTGSPSGSDACMVNVSSVPTVPFSVEPISGEQGGVGACTKTGGLLTKGTSRMSQSTPVELLRTQVVGTATQPGVLTRSSMITCVE